MVSRVLNFLWLNLELPAPPDPADGSIRMPMPEEYIEQARSAGERHPDEQIRLWIDSRRLTEKQLTYLRHTVEDECGNVRLMDLRTIPAYDLEPLYNEIETDPLWRNVGQKTVIWRQVDAAKVLVSLQDDFDQVFFADFDQAHLHITGCQVQEMLGKSGLFFGSKGFVCHSVENQLWGFNRSRRAFFEEYYAATLEAAYDGRNGWKVLYDKTRHDLERGEGMPREEFCLLTEERGPMAEQPGSCLQKGDGTTARPLLIPAGKLSAVFASAGNENSKKVVAQPARLSAAPLRSLR